MVVISLRVNESLRRCYTWVKLWLFVSSEFVKCYEQKVIISHDTIIESLSYDGR